MSEFVSRERPPSDPADNAEVSAARQDLLDRLPLAVAELDENGVVLRANALVAGVVGAAPDGAGGADLGRVKWGDGDLSDTGPTPVARMLAGEPVDEVLTVTGLDGRRRIVRVRAVPAQNGASALLLMADVTEDLHRERARSAYSDVYRAIAEHLSDVVLVTEAEVIVWVSPSVTPVLGYDPATLIGRQIATLVVPQDRLDLQVTPQAPTLATRTRYVTADGAHRWVDARVTAGFTADGSVGQVFHVLRDINEQKLAEDRAGEALLRERAALDASPDGFAIYRAGRDELGRVSALRLEFLNNAAIARLTIGSAADVMGRCIREIYPQAVSSGLWSDMLTTLATGEQSSRRLHDQRQGNALVTDIVVGRLDQDTLVATFRDTTASARQQEELGRALDDLSHAQRTLSSALDAIDYGFAICDAIRGPAGEVVDLQVVMINRAGAAMGGTTVEARVGTMMRKLTDQGRSRESWDKAVSCLNDQQPRRFREEHGTFGEPGWWVREVTISPLGRDRLALAGRDVTADEHIRRVADLIRAGAPQVPADLPIGLLDRAALLDRLGTALRGCAHGEQVAVVRLDLAGLQEIRDQQNQVTGEQVLVEVVRRLGRADGFLDATARFGRDQLVLLLRGVSDLPELERVLDRLVTRIEQPITTPHGSFRLQAGIALHLADPRHPTENLDPERVLDQAHSAWSRSEQGHDPDPTGFEGSSRPGTRSQVPDHRTPAPPSQVAMPSARHAPATDLGPTCGPADLARCRAVAHHAAPARDLITRPVCRRTRPIGATTIDPLLARIDAVTDQVRTWSPEAWQLLSGAADDNGERRTARRFARECAHYAGRDALLAYARSVIDLLAPAAITSTADSSALQLVHDAVLAALTADLLDPRMARTLHDLIPRTPTNDAD